MESLKLSIPQKIYLYYNLKFKMCGILSVFGDLQEKKSLPETMLHFLKHRGPDDTGLIKGKIGNNDFFLGHQRLSIIDVENGHQPLRSQDGTTYLICNGEIYNYKELKQQLSPEYSFSTESDNETILPLYQKNGTFFIKQLDGMFSFIMTDPKNIFIARDPIGIKPLYYGFDEKRIYFASEIKALVNHAHHIYEFPNGYYFHSTKGIKSYYHLPKNGNFITQVEDAIAAIKTSLKKSVKKRLRADVPIGVFLSGGLDSSVIAALMNKAIPELHSFSVGLNGSADLKAARIMADYLGTIHHEYIYTENEMLEILPEVIYYLESFDPALVRSAVPCFFVSRLASKSVKVILTGEGADELFAGYSYFNHYNNPHDLHKESIRIINNLHNINLQRVDRMTMAHGLEGRVPFLDTEFIETALKIDPCLKLHHTFGFEKWLLRKAYEDLLPDEITWRNKMEFAQGCGSSTIIEQIADNIPAGELERAQKQGCPVSSKEELFYYNIFKRHFDHPDVTKLVGRWQGQLL